MSLFQLGEFVLQSGESTTWKIECDALKEKDYATLAYIVANEWKLKFGLVDCVGPAKKDGVYTNAFKFVRKLRKYQTNHYIQDPILIVDDVLTTGQSIIEEMQHMKQATHNECEVQGVVIFARGDCPKWVRSIFQFYVK